MRTVKQLLAAVSQEEALQATLDILTSLNFPVTSWESGGIARTLVELFARLYSDFTLTVQTLTRSRYNGEATGDWLSILSESHFANTRIPAKPTIFDALLEADPGVGPYTVDIGDNLLADDDGRTFRNTTAGTVPVSGSVTLRYMAEIAGITPVPVAPKMQTPLGGVSVISTTLVQQGVKEESDERLRARNTARWASLSYASPEDSYRLWALQADVAVTRVRVNAQNPAGAGTIYVYIASDAPGTLEVNPVAVLNYINGSDGIGRRPIGADVSVFEATIQTITVIGTVYYDPNYVDTIEDEVRASITKHFASLPIGGFAGVFPRAGLYRAVMVVPGVINMALTSPNIDPGMAGNNVAVAALGGLSFEPVSG